MNNENDLLSIRGQQRRDEILAIVLEESRRVQRRRKRRRRFLGTTVMMLMLATVAWAYFLPREPDARTRATVADGRDATSSPSTFDLELYMVRTEVNDLDHYLVRTQEKISAGVILDDLQLLSMLADLGQTEGIVRVGGKTWLTSQLTSQLEREIEPSSL